MLYFYVIPSFITGIITFSWYSLYGLQFFRGNLDEDSLLKPSIPKWKHNVPLYMWELYKNGIGTNENSRTDIVKGVNPKFLGRYFTSPNYPNHGKQEIEFNVPETVDGETLIDAEIRIMTNEIRMLNVSFQIFHKDTDWLFVDTKAVQREGLDWISLSVTSSMKEYKKPYSITFLIVTVFRGLNNKNKAMEYLQPFLLLSYVSQHREGFANHTNSISYFQGMKAKFYNSRRKRNLPDYYEEKTNRIWKGESVTKKQQKGVNICKRKPLYIEFSDIDYDTWIVAPTGYEAFQCVGKCTFPVGEHLSPTNHAIIQTLMHYVSPKKVSRACCVPTKLDPISILYVDNNGILTYRLHYHGMVVAECGCR